jgi:hypothetical protein
MDAHSWSPERVFIEKQYQAAWADFLKHRLDVASRRALVVLHKIDVLYPISAHANSDKDADLLVTEADLAYIAGASMGDDQKLLLRARVCYRDHLHKAPANTNAMRMLAETLLRLSQ